MIDVPVVKRARRLVAGAEAIAARETRMRAGALAVVATKVVQPGGKPSPFDGGATVS